MEGERPQDGRGQQGLRPLRPVVTRGAAPAGSPARPDPAAGARGNLDVLILRDPRESARKCSLTPLRGRPGIRFVDYRRGRRLAAGSRVLLHPDGEPITAADRGYGLLLVDCAWRRVESLVASVDGELRPRRLPVLTTAYPRKSRVFHDPERGLASVEALYAALFLLEGDPRPELLAAYPWREAFLASNPLLLPRAPERSALS